ncbi:HDR001Wp [Eremothecium sinecaudum]|uniref:Nucleolar protein 16 n=1 Tax=Eremothecium sinecaudum TaxID=45286 RepID=A0A0X8HSN1_9SACH|nr:HDR001Wp [Eremothecium sinecaudum]AMD20744.1 HDR001Wp [Eremothecium sinecaudum]
MASVRKRKMARSSVRRVSRKNKDKQRKINISCNPIIERNWDYNLTLAQNYKKLGLRAKLGKLAGGEEPDLSKTVKKKPITNHSFPNIDSDENENEDKTLFDLDNEEEFDENKIPEGEARIQRSADGSVIRVVYGKMKNIDIDDDIPTLQKKMHQSENLTPVVSELLEYSNRPIVKRPRIQSSREEEWLERLYNKHGDDYNGMARDLKLNIYQQSIGDIKRRISKWKKKHNIS